LKKDIQQTQLQAALAVTRELIMLYWRTGKSLSEKITKEKWGAKTVERLANELKTSFPDVSGFSVRNLKYMRHFADSYQDPNWAAAAAQLPWGHNMVILDKLKDSNQRLWYIQQTIEHGWSRSMLEHWIESNLYKRKGKAVTNFKKTLPSVQSDLAEQALKDPYNFSFLVLDKKHREQELEQGLIDHIQKFLIELGDGFAFLGRQYRIEVDNDDYFMDLLFYHLKLRCYIVVELKATAFDPRDAGQMNFYLSAVDSLLKHPTDNPSIGILLCKTKSKIKAEYALRDINKPIGVTSYETKLVESLPKNLKASLPTVEEIEAELEKAKIIDVKEIKKLKKPAKKPIKKRGRK
ncbi:MAG: PDDEXK nuclease domain-containing protein, partial [bacterium]